MVEFVDQAIVPHRVERFLNILGHHDYVPSTSSMGLYEVENKADSVVARSLPSKPKLRRIQEASLFEVSFKSPLDDDLSFKSPLDDDLIDLCKGFKECYGAVIARIGGVGGFRNEDSDGGFE